MVNPGGSWRFLNEAMILAALDPLDRLRLLLEEGCPPRDALEAVSRDLPKRPRLPSFPMTTLEIGAGWDPWTLIRFLTACLDKRLIELPEAVDLLRGYRIHPWSLLWGDAETTCDGVPAWAAGLQVPDRMLARLGAGRAHGPHAGPHLEELPGDFKVDSLHLCDCPRLATIGPGLEAETDLDFTNCGLLASLPEGIRALRQICISTCSSFVRLPQGFACGSLWLRDLPSLESLSLPPGFTGGLLVHACPALGALGVGSRQLESLSLSRCPVARLPPELRVGRDLSLVALPLTGLPSGLQVAGTCRLAELPVCTTLGEGVRIGGDLVLDRLPLLRRVPGDLTVGGRVFLGRDLGPALLPPHLRDRVAPLEG